jgi:hypothetical protein
MILTTALIFCLSDLVQVINLNQKGVKGEFNKMVINHDLRRKESPLKKGVPRRLAGGGLYY